MASDASAPHPMSIAIAKALSSSLALVGPSRPTKSVSADFRNIDQFVTVDGTLVLEPLVNSNRHLGR